jgi:hypothetical protein
MSKLRACWKCAHFRPQEDRLGYCKLFGDTSFARLHKALCAPEGKWFKEATCVVSTEPRVVEPKKKDLLK